MLKNNRFIIITLCLTALLSLALISESQARPDRKPTSGEVKVCNNSDYEIYIEIGGRNEGKVWKNSTERFRVKLGSHSVRATVAGESASKSITLSPNSTDAEVTFKNDDFPDYLKEKLKNR